jgi:hypothetical protein
MQGELYFLFRFDDHLPVATNYERGVVVSKQS